MPSKLDASLKPSDPVRWQGATFKKNKTVSRVRSGIALRKSDHTNFEERSLNIDTEKK